MTAGLLQAQRSTGSQAQFPAESGEQGSDFVGIYPGMDRIGGQHPDLIGQGVNTCIWHLWPDEPVCR